MVDIDYGTNTVTYSTPRALYPSNLKDGER